MDSVSGFNGKGSSSFESEDYFPYVNGSINSRWIFGGPLLCDENEVWCNFTIVQITRYDPGALAATKNVLIRGSQPGFSHPNTNRVHLFGHWNGRSGVTYYHMGPGWTTKDSAPIVSLDVNDGAKGWLYEIDTPEMTYAIDEDNRWATATATQYPDRRISAFRPTINQPGSGGSSDWNVAELIIYDRVLSEGEINQMKTWLETYRSGNFLHP